MSETRKHDPALYQGTAWYYARFRPPYPAAMEKILREKFCPDGTGRLLDLGCGPGLVAIRLAHLFDQVIAIDPEPEMLVEGKAAAERAGVSNLEWRHGSSEDLSPKLGRFRLVTIGNAFHWMDRARTLDALYDLVTEGGGLAVASHGAPIPPPPPTPWRAAINRVIRQYLGDRPLPWKAPGPSPEERHEAYLSRALFKDVTTYAESFDIRWTLDSIIGNLYSTSFCSRRLLGDRVEAFERDLRSSVLNVELAGDLRGEPPEFFAMMASKR